MPCLAMAARISSRVKSGCLAIRAKIQSECSSNGETLPPLGFGAALPVSLQRWHHRTTELTPTLKISAISRRDAPLSPASTARSRKSVAYGLDSDSAHFPLMLIHNLDVARNWRTLPGKPCEEASEFCARDLVSFARPLVATVL